MLRSSPKKAHPSKVQHLFIAYSAKCMFLVPSAGFPYSFSTYLGTTLQCTLLKKYKDSSYRYTGLTLAPEVYGLLATLQPIHEHLHLRSGWNWGCRMSENKRWEVVKQTTSTTLCKIYLVSVPHYILRHSIRQCDCLSVSEVEDYKHITITDVMGVRNNLTPWETLQVSPLLSLTWAWNKAT